MRSAKLYGEYESSPDVVKLLVDTAGPLAIDYHKKFFEPGCGKGSILLEVFRRRLARIKEPRDILVALSNIYGADIIYQNIFACREAIRGILSETLQEKHLDYRFWPCVELLLEKNLFQADLTGDLENIEVVEWEFAAPFCPTAHATNLAAIVKENV